MSGEHDADEAQAEQSRSEAASADARATAELSRALLAMLGHVRRDPALRATLRAFGEALVAWADPASAGDDAFETRAGTGAATEAGPGTGSGARVAQGAAERQADGLADGERGGAPESQASAGGAGQDSTYGSEAGPAVGMRAHRAEPSAAEAASDAPDTPDASEAPTESLARRMADVLSQRDEERAQATVEARRHMAESADDGARPATRDASARDAAESAEAAAAREAAHLLRISAKARVLAAASRWVGTRQQRIARGADWASEIAPGDQTVRERVAEAGAQAWMCREDAPVPPDLHTWETLAGCYEAVADALDYVALVLEHDTSRLDEAFLLLAEAQSGLRIIVSELDERVDEIQRAVFYWLRHQTEQRRIFVPRFMRLNDPADPAAWGEVRERIEEQDEALRGVVEQERLRRKQWGRLRYHMGRITKRSGVGDPGAAADPELVADWSKSMEAVDLLVGSGLAPSSVELRDALAAHVDALPDDVTPGKHALLALREIDRYLASREAAAAAEGGGEDADEVPRSPEEERVRALLSGKAMVLIGGQRRPRHVAALTHAFDLSELVWLDGGTVSYTQFEAPIARKDVAVVVLMIRWSSHGYGDVKSFCDAYDKPLIRLPAGYNSRQVAFQILEQAGERLGGGVEG